VTVDFARTEWDRACDAIRDAQFLVSNGGFDSAASRAYYAIFHALTALFALESRTFSARRPKCAAGEFPRISVIPDVATGNTARERGRTTEWIGECEDLLDVMSEQLGNAKWIVAAHAGQIVPCVDRPTQPSSCELLICTPVLPVRR
jgi:hypothetical protein